MACLCMGGPNCCRVRSRSQWQGGNLPDEAPWAYQWYAWPKSWVIYTSEWGVAESQDATALGYHGA